MLHVCHSKQIQKYKTAYKDYSCRSNRKKDWNNIMVYAREILYGQLVTSLLGCLREFYSFNLPDSQSSRLRLDNDTATLLCHIKKGHGHDRTARGIFVGGGGGQM